MMTKTKCQREFEKWSPVYNKNLSGAILNKDDKGNYVNFMTHGNYQIWQAAWKAAVEYSKAKGKKDATS